MSNIKPINVSNSDIEKIISILEKSNNSGVYSDVQVSNAYLSFFNEVGDSGPIWHGEKDIKVENNGFLITYKFDREDKTVDKTKVAYQSSDWHSDNKIFISWGSKKQAFRRYTCRFGGIPPSFGSGQHKIKWTQDIENLLNILSPYRKKYK